MSAPDPQQRIRLIVLFGGQSAEHDVSLSTAAHVLAAADPARYDIIPVGISRDGQWTLSDAAMRTIESGTRDFGERVDPSGAPTSLDRHRSEGESDDTTVVMPLLHGPMGEDGTVQGMLELADVAYVGDGVLASAVAMDKTVAKQLFRAANIPQCAYITVHESEWTARSATLVEEIIAELGTPLFVKPANMGSSVGVTKARDAHQLSAAIELALTYDAWVVVEEAVAGREIELAVIGNTDPVVSVPGEIVPGDDFYSYDDKYLNGASTELIPADLSDADIARVQALALEAYRALRCEGLARCDFFFEQDGRGFLCNEVNTMPGFTPISMFPKLMIASGWTYAEIIDRLVDLALERHSRRRRNTGR